MLVKIESIKHNPLRDFTLYPIDKIQVEKLAASIEKDSFWAGLPAREVDGEYEILAGHHRLEAAKKAGLEEIELNVGDYSDDDMASIMVAENLTQRGSQNFGATIEAVAAVCRNLAKEIMGRNPGDEPDAADADAHKTWTANRKSIETSQGLIKKGGGVGRDAVVKKLDGQVTQYTAGQAIDVLKWTGMYAKVLKGIVSAKILKDKYGAKHSHLEKAYTAIASFDSPGAGIAFMKTAAKCPSLTKAQYLALANNIRLDAKGKPLTSSVISKAVEEKTGFTSGDDDGSMTPREQQIDDEIKIRKLAESFIERLGVFAANYPVETTKLVNEIEWPDKLKKALTTVNAYEFETPEETKVADEADLAETDKENDIEAEEAADAEVEL